MMEYFCAYHSMLGATRKLSDAECGRLFRALLAYSGGEESINLQGREELLFDVFAQQIDRDRERYVKKCMTNKANGSGRKRSQANGSVRDQEKEKDKEKDKEEELPPTPSKGGTPDGGGTAYVEQNLRYMSPDNWGDLHSYLDDGITMELVCHAVDEACANGKRTWGYVRKIIQRYLEEDIKTVEQAKASNKKPQTKSENNGLNPWLQRSDYDF